MLELDNCLAVVASAASELFNAATSDVKVDLTADIAICPEVSTFVMLATIALGLPVAFSWATAVLKWLTSEQ